MRRRFCGRLADRSRRGTPRRGARAPASTSSIRSRSVARAPRAPPPRCRAGCRPTAAGSRRRSASCRAARRRRWRAGRGPAMRWRPARLTSRFASTCGRWLVSATSRSCASGVDRDRERAELGDEAVHLAVALGVGVRGRGQKPGRALEEPRGGVLGARAPPSRPSDGRRQTGGEPAAAATTLAFVEPTSVTVASLAGRRRAPPRPRAGSAAIGAATTTSSRIGERGVERRRRIERAPPATAASSAAGSGSQPATAMPLRARGEARARRRSARCRRW